jgi:hypothetical protein
MWRQDGPPPAVGYFLFFDVLPAESAARDVEGALRKLWIAPPVASSFAWVRYVGGEIIVSVSTRLALTLNETNSPVVEQDTPLALPPGMPTLTFAGGAPVIGSFGLGGTNGFVIAYPPLIGARAPNGKGLFLPLAGVGVGSVRFEGLVNLPGRPRPRARWHKGGAQAVMDEAFKALVHVQIDPMHPFDPMLTYQRFVGRDYLLRRTVDGYVLIPAR